MLLGDKREQLEKTIRETLVSDGPAGEADDVAFAVVTAKLPGSLLGTDGVVGVSASRLVLAVDDILEGPQLHQWPRDEIQEVEASDAGLGRSVAFTASQGEVRLEQVSREGQDRLMAALARFGYGGAQAPESADEDRAQSPPPTSDPEESAVTLEAATPVEETRPPAPSPGESTTRCPECGKEQKPHYKFCLGCGAALGTKPADPSPSRWARGLKLVGVAGEVRGLSFLVEPGEITIGRVRGAANLVIATSDLSRRHAKLTVRPDRCWIEDLGSSNGTYVNGELITGPTELRAGARIRIGREHELEVGEVSDGDTRGLIPLRGTRSAARGRAGVASGSAAGGQPRQVVLLAIVVAIAIALLGIVMVFLAGP